MYKLAVSDDAWIISTVYWLSSRQSYWLMLLSSSCPWFVFSTSSVASILKGGTNPKNSLWGINTTERIQTISFAMRKVTANVIYKVSFVNIQIRKPKQTFWRIWYMYGFRNIILVTLFYGILILWMVNKSLYLHSIIFQPDIP